MPIWYIAVLGAPVPRIQRQKNTMRIPRKFPLEFQNNDYGRTIKFFLRTQICFRSNTKIAYWRSENYNSIRPTIETGIFPHWLWEIIARVEFPKPVSHVFVVALAGRKTSFGIWWSLIRKRIHLLMIKFKCLSTFSLYYWCSSDLWNTNDRESLINQDRVLGTCNRDPLLSIQWFR